MSDHDFLIWLHERLVHVHGEDGRYDYMHKLRAIIQNIPKGRVTPNIAFNSMEELLENL
ncbi:hypothetical protein D3C85_392740 [compost metagenome]